MKALYQSLAFQKRLEFRRKTRRTSGNQCSPYLSIRPKDMGSQTKHGLSKLRKLLSQRGSLSSMVLNQKFWFNGEILFEFLRQFLAFWNETLPFNAWNRDSTKPWSSDFKTNRMETDESSSTIHMHYILCSVISLKNFLGEKPSWALMSIGVNIIDLLNEHTSLNVTKSLAHCLQSMQEGTADWS